MFILVLFSINVFSAEKNRKLVFSIDADPPVSFTLDMSKAVYSLVGPTLIIDNAISDFSLPFNAYGTQLTGEYLGGDIVVNRIEITGYRITFRIAADGTGPGLGNLGGSVLVIANLDKSITGKDNKIITDISGNLSYSDTDVLKNEQTYTLEDLAAVGAKSEAYTAILYDEDKGSLFNGFVVFDPTNPESISDAYFEMGMNQADYSWTLTTAE